MLKDILWFYGFKIFYNVRHPVLSPFKILRRVISIFKKNEPAALEKNILPKTLPKKIWIFWAQGWDNAPPLVKLCRDSWIVHNPDWEVALLSDGNISEYVTLNDFIKGGNITYAAYSDVVRIKLLSKYGGVWADATTFCSAPLNTWLTDLMQSGFFAFNKPKTTIASWFTASEENNFLIKRWEEYVDLYWKFARSPGRYFWFHYLFEYMLMLDSRARTIWFQTPKISADGSYAAQRCLKVEGERKDECANIISSGISPVHKLDWKIEVPEGFLSKIRLNLNKL